MKKTKKKIAKRKVIGAIKGYLLILPLFSLLGVFKYYSFFYAIFRSLYNWNGLKTSIFIGISNYVNLIHDKIFLGSTLNLLLLLVTSLLKALIFPFIAARLVFYLKSKKTQEISKYLFVLPMIVPTVVIILLWGWIFDTDGMVNLILRSIGLGNFAVPWLASSDTALGAIIFMGFPWVGGIAFLIYMAGLQGIPDGLYEAVKLEGAGTLRTVFSLELPLIMGQLRYIVITTIIATIQFFDPIFILTNGGPGKATMVPAVYLYQEAFSFQKFGYACAIGVVIFVLVMIITVFNMKFMNSDYTMD